MSIFCESDNFDLHPLTVANFHGALKNLAPLLLLYRMTLAPPLARVEEEQRMERNENVMLIWMCGVTLRDKVFMVELRRRLRIEGVVEVMRRGRLRWFGHVERKDVRG